MKFLEYLSLIFILFFIACSRNDSYVRPVVNVISMENFLKATSSSSNVVVYGSSSEGKSFSKKLGLGSQNSQTLELPRGVWNLYAIVWQTNGNGAFTGLTECGKKENLNLTDSVEKIDIEILVNNSNCNDSVISPFVTIGSDGSYLLPIIDGMTCINTIGVNQFDTGFNSCHLGLNQGFARWYKIKYFDTSNFDSSNQDRSLTLASNCYEIPLTELADSSYPRTPLNFPLNSLMIEFYYGDFPCDEFDGVQEIQLSLESNSLYFPSEDNSILRFFHADDTNILYNPRDVEISEIGKNSITLSWKHAGNRVEGYRIFVSTNSSIPSSACSSRSAINVNKNAISHEITGLDIETEYYFRICAYDRNFNMSSGIVTSSQTLPRALAIQSRRIDGLGGTLSVGSEMIIELTFSERVKFNNFTSENIPKIAIGLEDGDVVYATLDSDAGDLNEVHEFHYTFQYGDYLQNADNMNFGVRVQTLGSATAEDSLGNLVNLDLSETLTNDIDKSKVITCPNSATNIFLHVPKNPTVGVDYNFCVMKYEAQIDSVTGNITSIPSQSSLINKTASEAFDLCGGTDINGDANPDGLAQLITNAESMVIARNIEIIGSNWTSGTVGVGRLFRGNADKFRALNPTLALITPSIDDNDGYSGTGNDATEELGIDQRRTFTLSNGEIIWDFAGNAAEFVDWSKDDAVLTSGPTNCAVNASSNADGHIGLEWFTNVGAGKCLTTSEAAPLNSSFDSSDNIGKIYEASQTGAPVQTFGIRGGSFQAPNDIGGIYSLVFFDGNKDNQFGFRCVIRP